MPYSRLTLDSSAGQQYAPQIRCDRNVVRDNSRGCVLPDAAAVLITSVLDSTVSEAAQHIRDAQTQLQPWMTELAPGVYQPLPGTRAVAQTGQSESQFQPLLYLGDSTLRDANREASCGAAPSSLYNARQYTGSGSCPLAEAEKCSCDEYPYASTFNGATNFPNSTSVRGILLEHNRAQGSQLSSFLQTQRIIPTGIAGSDGFYVFVKQ